MFIHLKTRAVQYDTVRLLWLLINTEQNVLVKKPSIRTVHFLFFAKKQKKISFDDKELLFLCATCYVH